MKKAIQFGAGNIGRGFTGQLFSQSGYEVVFIDIVEPVINSLNEKRSYIIKVVGNNPQEIVINNVRAVNIRNENVVAKEIKTADILCTAVGVNILDKIAPVIAKGIELRANNKIVQPLNIIICENLLDSAHFLKNQINKHCSCYDYIDKYIGFVESVVSRMIPVVPDEIKQQNPTLIMVEEYCVLPVDKKGFKGAIPEIKGLLPQDNFKGYEERKLFIHNLGHSMFAYLGYLKGYEYIWQAVADNELNNIVSSALKESGTALIKKHGFTQQEMKEHVADLFYRFSNKQLGDTVYRVGRDPLRKLSFNDRLIGGARLALEYGIIPENICIGISAALCYDYPKDEQAVRLKKMLEEKSIENVLIKISGLKHDNIIIQLVKETYNSVKTKYKIKPGQ